MNHWSGQINIHDDFEPSGVVDIDTEVLEHANELWGVEEDAIASTIDEALATGIKADVALICTPINTHHGISIEAMRNGLHVICEKNMAHSMQAGLEMTKCAIKHPELATVVGHQYPYWRPINWAIKKAIRNGKLGNLNSIQCVFNGGGYWNPTTPTRNGWRRFLDHPYMEDWAVHTLDLFRSFTSMDPMVVSADLWRPPWSRRYGTSSINIKMLMAKAEEYEGVNVLEWTDKTSDARRKWKNGKTPDSWVHAQYNGHADGMGLFAHGEHWMIQGSKGSIEFLDGGLDKKRKAKARMITHDFDMEKIDEVRHEYNLKINWNKTKLKPEYDLECGAAAQWKGDNTEEEWLSGCFMLEELKQCIESNGKIKPLRCFEDCLKTFSITMGAIESSKNGGKPVFLPDLWEIPRNNG